MSSPPIANFVHKTFQILRLQQHSAVICWLPSGREFIIKSSDTFENVTLPRYFRHRNVNSFIRQLNMYGFHKSRREPTKLIFSHPCFIQGREDLLVMVKRKLKNEADREEQEEDQLDEEKIEDKCEEKQEFLTSQSTKFSLETEERFISQHSTSTHPNSLLCPIPHPDQEQIFAINSFFNIDYESFELKNLLSNRSYLFEGSSEAYMRMQEAPSLRQIGTQQYLVCNSYKENKQVGRDSFPVRIFETKNCLLDIDI